MRKSKIILISLCLMTLSACSTTKPVPPELKVITEVVKPTPPKPLTDPCGDPEPREIVVTRDIVLSRQDYINAYNKCKALHKNLSDWTLSPLPARNDAAQKIK